MTTRRNIGDFVDERWAGSLVTYEEALTDLLAEMRRWATCRAVDFDVCASRSSLPAGARN